MALPATVAVGAPITSTDHNALIPQILRVREEQTSGTAGGGFTSGSFTKRLLNTVALNEITGASMTSSVITLPAGTYNVQGYAAAFQVGSHKTKLRQTSGTPTDQVQGSTANNTTATAIQTESRLEGRMVLTGSTTLEFQHWCSSTKATNGFGAPATAGVNEVYSEIVFVKVG